MGRKLGGRMSSKNTPHVTLDFTSNVLAFFFFFGCSYVYFIINFGWFFFFFLFFKKKNNFGLISYPIFFKYLMERLSIHFFFKYNVLHFVLFNRDMIVNLYKLYFQPNKKVFHPSTFPLSQPRVIIGYSRNTINVYSPISHNCGSY